MSTAGSLLFTPTILSSPEIEEKLRINFSTLFKNPDFHDVEIIVFKQDESDEEEQQQQLEEEENQLAEKKDAKVEEEEADNKADDEKLQKKEKIKIKKEELSTEIFFAHKAVLYSRSEFFRALIDTSSSSSSKIQTIDLTSLAPSIRSREFHSLLSFMYSARLPILSSSSSSKKSKEKLVNLAQMIEYADILKILPGVQEIFSEYLVSRSLDPSIACYMLLQSHLQSQTSSSNKKEQEGGGADENQEMMMMTTTSNSKVTEKCLEFIEDHTTECFTNKFMLKFPIELVIQILESNKLSVSETDVFDFIQAWAKANSSSSSSSSSRSSSTYEELVQKLIPFVRFPQMTVMDLKEKIEPSNLVPIELLLEAYRYLAIQSSALNQLQHYNLRTTPRSCSRVYFTFDPTKVPTGATLSNNNLVVRNSGQTASLTCLSTLEMREGRHYFEVKVQVTQPHSYIMVGVADRSTVNQMSFLSHNLRGWAIYADGTKYHNSSARPYATAFAQNTIIGVFLDFFAKQIRFFINGEDKGVAFENLTGPVCAAVTLYSPGDELVLNPVAPLPRGVQKH